MKMNFYSSPREPEILLFIFFLILAFPLWNILQNHVRGHTGNHGNEMADTLARAGAKKIY